MNFYCYYLRFNKPIPLQWPQHMKILKKLQLFSLIWTLILIGTPSLGKEFILSTGERKSFPIKGNTIWIEKKSIITGKVQGRSLIITGHNVGSSYLKLNESLYKIQVVKPQNQSLFKKINQLFTSKLGLMVSTKNSQVYVTGELYKMNDWIDIAQLVEDEDDYTFKAAIADNIHQEAQAYFNKIFRENGLPEQKIQIGNTPLLRLHPQDFHFKEYENLLKPFGIKVVKDKTSLTLAPVVKVQITVAEMNRGFAQNYGVDFADTYKAEVLPTTKIKEFEAKLHFLETSGQGKLLASPNIICRSGKEAEFLAGGEFPIKTRSKFGNDIVWKKYGILLKVNPKADSIGRMSIGIQSEVSSIDKSLSIDGIPAISTNKVSSYFDLTDSKIIALSGLLTDIRNQGYSGFPFLSRLPILGTLFSSRDFLNKRTELIIFVKPSIMKMTEDYHKVKNKPQHLGDL